ncbi:hypothetical protein GCM10027361_29960 [Erwinia aphidicola]
MRWLHSFTRITYQRKLIGTHSFAAFLQLELFRVSLPAQTRGIFHKLSVNQNKSFQLEALRALAVEPDFSLLTRR